MAIANETIDQRPAAVEFAYGRAFYGVNSTVYFSQVMEQQNIEFLARCFQANDPTSGEISDLVDTDGGTIPIDDATTIVSIKSFVNGILIFATNGVWLLRGGEAGFTATTQTLTNMTTMGCVSGGSVIKAEGDVYYWSTEGVVRVGLNEQGVPQAINISDGKIDDFYAAIPDTLKTRVTSNYDPKEKEIHWFYSDDTTGMLDAKNKGLIYSLRLDGFFPDEYNGNLIETVEDDFLVGKLTVYTPATGNKTIVLSARPKINGTNTEIRVGIGEENETFEDYYSPYPTAYFETFNETLGAPSNVKKVTDITTQMVQTEQNWVDDGAGGLELDNPSSCLMTSKWDWNNSDANGRWGDPQQIYRRRRLSIPSGAGPYDPGEEYLSYKANVRGRGRALRLKFEQEDNKDMKILGWTVTWSMKPNQ